MVVKNNRRAPKTLRKPNMDAVWRARRLAQWRADRTFGAHWVNVYHMYQEYGGPEEGGWYYDSWEIVESIRKRTRGRAEELAERLRRAQYPDHRNRSKSNYWNKRQDYRVSVEKTPGEDDSNYQPWC